MSMENKKPDLYECSGWTGLHKFMGPHYHNILQDAHRRALLNSGEWKTWRAEAASQKLYWIWLPQW